MSPIRNPCYYSPSYWVTHWEFGLLESQSVSPVKTLGVSGPEALNLDAGLKEARMGWALGVCDPLNMQT